MKQHERQPDAYERSDRIVGAGLCGPQLSLGVDVEEDAEAIGEKSQQERPEHGGGAGSDSPTARAMASDPRPEPNPLSTTISSGSLCDIMRVQLFSNPQQTQAASTSGDPEEKLRLEAPSNERMRLERAMRPMASHSLRLMASLNTRSAMSDVATISKLLSRDAWAEVVEAGPIIKQMGAATSRTIMPTV